MPNPGVWGPSDLPNLESCDVNVQRVFVTYRRLVTDFQNPNRQSRAGSGGGGGVQTGRASRFGLVRPDLSFVGLLAGKSHPWTNAILRRNL